MPSEKLCANIVWTLVASAGTAPISRLDVTRRVPSLIVVNECHYDFVEPSGVDFADLLALLTMWGQIGGEADLAPPGGVGFAELLALLSSWGPCP